MTPKYPDITIPLTGEDGNAFFIIGRVKQTLRRSGLDDWEEIWEAYQKKATSGDYDNVLTTTMEFFETT